jgi:hypothetical protein
VLDQVIPVDRGLGVDLFDAPLDLGSPGLVEALV